MRDVVLPRIRAAHRETPEARIGLVAGRPADVLAVTGWGGLGDRGEPVLPLTAVLRSGEDRFDARLIDVGYADLRLFVACPPRTLETAQRIAVEQVVLADECTDAGRHVPDIAARLVNAPVWTFWWDLTRRAALLAAALDCGAAPTASAGAVLTPHPARVPGHG